MPNLTIDPILTQSLVAPADTAGGTGNPGLREEVGGLGAALSDGAQLYQQHQQEQARVWAGNAVTSFHVSQLQAAKQVQSDAQDAVGNGQPVPDMTGTFLTQFDSGAQAILATAPNRMARTYMQEQMGTTRMRLADQVVNQQATLERQWKLSSFDTSTNNAGKIVQQDPSTFDDQMGNLIATLPHIDPETDARRAVAARNVLTNAAATSALDTNPDQLKDLTGKAMGEGGFKGPTGVGYVDTATPEQVHLWNNMANAKIAQRDAAAARAQAAAETAAGAAHNQLADFVNSGQTPDMDYVNSVSGVTKGTTFEADTQRLVQVGLKGAGFGSQSLPRQQQILGAMDAQDTTSGSDPATQAARKQLQTINDAQTAAYKDNPWDAAARFAHVPVPPAQPITSVAQGLQLVQQRAALQPTVEAAAGKPVSPFQPDEAAQMGMLIRQLPPDQAASALTQIGGALQDPQRIAAVAKQFNDKDGTLGLAMAYSGAPGQGAPSTSSGKTVAEWILRGDQALKDKTSSEDNTKQTGWKATIASSIRGAYPNQQVEDSAIDAAMKITAGLDAAGVSTGDTDAGVTLATGGIISHGASNGKIPLPYGMQSASKFEAKLSAIQPADIASQTPDSHVYAGGTMMPVQTFLAKLPDATLVHAGQGLYNVRAGNSLVTNQNGQRITLQVKP